MMLIEVMISALLVALIAVGTLNGLDSTSRATADQRSHSQASVIAQQDEERLRGEPITQLAQFGSSTRTVAENGLCVEQVSGKWRYASKKALEETSACEKTTLATEYAEKAEAGATYTATVFTVASSASYVTASKETLLCETEKGTADYLKTTSAVTWPSLNSARPAVSQSSLVAVPSGASSTMPLMVKVTNRAGEPLSGATVKVTGTGVNATQTTPSSGCVVFGALAASEVEVVAEKAGYVDINGKSPPPALEKQLSASAVTEASFKLEASGAIAAEFESNGASAESFTFDAQNTEMASPQFFVGGSPTAAGHTAELTGVFPFKSTAYTVFAGDCEANNPETVTASGEKLKAPTALVEPGATKKVKVEAPAINVTVYEGESSGKPESTLGSGATSVYSAKLNNTECKGKTALNYGSGVTYEHSISISAGKLVPKAAPYAKSIELCVVGKNGSTYYKNKTTFVNNAKAGTTASNFYLKAFGYTKSFSAITC